MTSSSSDWTVQHFTFSSSDTLNNTPITISLKAQPAADTHGLFVWPGALELCRFVLRFPDLFRDKRVVELGAGVGLTSLLLWQACQPRKFVCTDGDADVMPLLHENVSRAAERHEDGESTLSAEKTDCCTGCSGSEDKEEQREESRKDRQTPFIGVCEAEQAGRDEAVNGCCERRCGLEDGEGVEAEQGRSACPCCSQSVATHNSNSGTQALGQTSSCIHNKNRHNKTQHNKQHDKCCLQSALLEWNNPSHMATVGLDAYDIVIGSDLMFDDDVQPLFATVQHLLATDGCNLFITSYTHRSHFVRQVMRDCAAQCGMRCVTVPHHAFSQYSSDVSSLTRGPQADQAADGTSVLVFYRDSLPQCLREFASMEGSSLGN